MSRCGVKWSKVESSIPDQDPHTSHIASVSPSSSHQKQPLNRGSFSITCNYLAWCCTQCGPIVQWLCFLPLVYPSVSSPPGSARSRFCPSYWTGHGFPPVLRHHTSALIPSLLLCCCLLSGVAALTLIEISSHHRRRPIKMQMMTGRGRKAGVGALCAQWAVPPGASRIDLLRGLRGFPGRQMVDLSDDVTAMLSGCSWLGYHQHTQRVTLGGFNRGNDCFCSCDAVIDAGVFFFISPLLAEIITCLCGT